MSNIGKTRNLLYRLARFLGWIQMVEDTAKGHPERALKRLLNKGIGRTVGNKIYLK